MSVPLLTRDVLNENLSDTQFRRHAAFPYFGWNGGTGMFIGNWIAEIVFQFRNTNQCNAGQCNACNAEQWPHGAHGSGEPRGNVRQCQALSGIAKRRIDDAVMRNHARMRTGHSNAGGNAVQNIQATIDSRLSFFSHGDEIAVRSTVSIWPGGHWYFRGTRV